MNVVPITKRIEIIISIQICLISLLNISYKEIGEKKAFLANPKHQYHVCQYGEHDYCAINEKKGDYYKFPSLNHFTNIR